jgi:hypothetical protein
MKGAFRILVRKPEWKIHLEDLSVDGSYIRMYLREIGWEEDWIHLAQDSPVTGSCEHGNEPLVCVRGGEFLE